MSRICQGDGKGYPLKVPRGEQIIENLKTLKLTIGEREEVRYALENRIEYLVYALQWDTMNKQNGIMNNCPHGKKCMKRITIPIMMNKEGKTMNNVENQIDTWEIKMVHTMTLWGIITPFIEVCVARYSSMIDYAKTLKEKLELEKEFIITMYFHGIVCE